MQDPRKARLWIALKVLEEMEMYEGRIENERLADVITKIFDSAKELRNVADQSVAGPEFHVNMARMNEQGVLENPSERDWNELARNFPVVIALLISLHGSLSINVNVPERELEPIRQKFSALLKGKGSEWIPNVSGSCLRRPRLRLNRSSPARRLCLRETLKRLRPITGT